MEQMGFNIEVKLLRENVIAPLSKLFESKDKKDKKAIIIEFECEKEKIMIKEKDSSNVMFMSIELDEGIISDYTNDLKDDEISKIAFDLNKLQDILTDLTGIISFELDSENKRLILKSGAYTYELGLNIVRKDKKHPELESTENSIDIKGQELYTIFKKCSGINKFVDVKLIAETDDSDFLLSFIARESGTNTKVKVELNEFGVSKYNAKSDCSNAFDTFNTGFLDLLKESVGKMPTIRVFMKDNYPLLIHYEIIEGHGKVILGVAPRLVSE